jgi:RNA polymerase sigma-70 factor (ECF subfamily)
VTANRVLLELRRRKRDRQVVSEVSREWPRPRQKSLGPDEQLIHVEEVEATMRCLSEMDESTRMVLVMRYFCELKSNEIGQIMELEPGTVRKRLYKGRTVLAEALLNKGIRS